MSSSAEGEKGTTSTISSASLLSQLQRFASVDSLPTVQPHEFHIFAADGAAPPWDALRDLISTTNCMTANLEALTTSPHLLDNIDTKTIALLKQEMAERETLFMAEQDTKQRVKALREMSKGYFGADIPILPVLVSNWCIDKIESWGKAAGMECFKEPQPVGDHDQIMIVFGGKILVIDIVVAVYNDPTNPRIELTSVRTSLATAEQTSAPATSNSKGTVDSLLFNALQDFFTECQKSPLDQDCMLVQSLGETFEDHLRQLVKLDNLISTTKDGDNLTVKGISWLEEIGTLGSLLEEYASKEMAALTSGTSQIPLDILLLRSHGLPLTFLTSVSVALLLHVSPVGYLSIRNFAMSQGSSDPRNDWSCDIPLQHIKSVLRRRSSPPGIVRAVLRLVDAPALLLASPPSANMEVDAPPAALQKSPLIPFPDRLLPQPPPDPGSSNMKQPHWLLDFSSQNIVLSKGRMRRIQACIDQPDASAVGHSLGIRGDSTWLDLLFDPTNNTRHDRYLATVESPSAVSPNLKVSLDSPSELGFMLGRVPVKTIQEVLEVIEIIKEQSWINELLRLHQWVPEPRGWQQSTLDALAPTDVAEADLAKEIAALLDKTHVPKELQIGASISSPAPGLSDGPQIKLVVPTKSRALTTVHIAYNPSRPRGVRVSVNGSDVEDLEEVARRGGVFAVCSRVWAMSD